MRALANKVAQKALEKAGQKGLEESLFKGVFEQIRIYLKAHLIFDLRMHHMKNLQMAMKNEDKQAKRRCRRQNTRDAEN